MRSIPVRRASVKRSYRHGQARHAVDQHVEAGAKPRPQSFTDLRPSRFECIIGNAAVPDRQVIPVDVPVQHPLAEFRHMEAFEFMSLDEGHDGSRVPRCHDVQIEAQIAVPGAGQGTRLLLSRA